MTREILIFNSIKNSLLRSFYSTKQVKTLEKVWLSIITRALLLGSVGIKMVREIGRFILGKRRSHEFLEAIFAAASITNIFVQQSDAALVSTSLTLLPIIIDAANVVNPRCNAVIWKHGFSFASLISDFYSTLSVHRAFMLLWVLCLYMAWLSISFHENIWRNSCMPYWSINEASLNRLVKCNTE